jgi:glutamine synthetase
MHVHKSLAYEATGANPFADPYGLSQTAQHFIAGQLAHARDVCHPRAVGELL